MGCTDTPGYNLPPCPPCPRHGAAARYGGAWGVQVLALGGWCLHQRPQPQELPFAVVPLCSVHPFFPLVHPTAGRGSGRWVGPRAPCPLSAPILGCAFLLSQESSRAPCLLPCQPPLWWRAWGGFCPAGLRGRTVTQRWPFLSSRTSPLSNSLSTSAAWQRATQRRQRGSSGGRGEMPPAVPRPLLRETSWVAAIVFCSCCRVSPGLLPLGCRAQGVSWLLPTTAGFPLSSAMYESRSWLLNLGLQGSGHAHPAADAAGQVKPSSSSWEPCTCPGRLALV